jgi:hypothetical protein
MDDTQSPAVRLRMQQAWETLKEADTLLENDLWRGVINRAYYAMFYAVLALAAFKAVVVTKHTHAIAFFDKEFVRSGAFPRELSRSLHSGFDQRQGSDYGELSEIEYGDAERSFSEAKAFVETVDAYLKAF